MQIEQVIDGLLARVQEAYPPLRVEAIRTRTDAVWRKTVRQDRVTYVCDEFPPEPFAGECTPFQRDLVEQLEMILRRGAWDCDYFPALSPKGQQVTLPSAFGCTEKIASDSTEVIPIIRQVQDIATLPAYSFSKETVAGQVLEKMRYFYHRTHGSLYLYETDMQGPFSLASQMWGIEPFLIACYDEPDAVHQLLERCTACVMDFLHAMAQAVPGKLIPMHCMPLLYLAPEHGVAVSEDLAAVISPELFTEFVRPYLETIAKAFGGVVMHSCGSLNHIAQELADTKGLVGVNCSSTETDIAGLAKFLKPEQLLITHNSPVTCNQLPLIQRMEHLRRCREIARTHPRILAILNPWNEQADASTQAAGFAQTARFDCES